jgi:hypothetical protein
MYIASMYMYMLVVANLNLLRLPLTVRSIIAAGAVILYVCQLRSQASYSADGRTSRCCLRCRIVQMLTFILFVTV